MNTSIRTLGASNLTEKQRANYDFYATNPIAINHLLIKMPQLKECKFVLEPCAGIGTLADRFTQITGTPVDMYDIVSRRNDIKECDYMELKCKNAYDLIITNFPYKEGTKKDPVGFSELLIKTLKDVMPGGYVCSFQRLLQLESMKRYERLYSLYKPEIIYVYSFRMKCFINGNMNQEYSSAVAYSWAVWHKDLNGDFSKETKLDWIYDK